MKLHVVLQEVVDLCRLSTVLKVGNNINVS
jgi:hypothetical protein